jgi:hypothetical protein
MKRIFVAASLIYIIFSSYTVCQETVKESSTGKLFPAGVTFNHGGKEYSLQLTGIAVRKKFIFKVYEIAHYVQDVGIVKNEDDAYTTILTDGNAKQIIMDFARDVDVAKIKEAYTDGFKNHATQDELRLIQTFVDQFIGYFSKDVKENDRFILRWLPGGSIVSVLQGEEKPIITDKTFARVLWSIWFGKDSIVDRDDLVKRMIKK